MSNDVYSRLADPRSFTGMYRKRFDDNGRTTTGDTSLYLSKDEGNGLPKTDEIIHDISVLMRPNLNHNVTKKTTKSHAVLTSSVRSPIKTIQAFPAAPRSPAKIMKESKTPDSPQVVLKALFQYYCRFGRTASRGVDSKTLDNVNFAKFCRDCPGLLDENFSKTDIDLIFIKTKKKGERRINFARFLDAIGMIAIEKYHELDLEQSVPKLYEHNIKKLPCLIEEEQEEKSRFQPFNFADELSLARKHRSLQPPLSRIIDKIDLKAADITGKKETSSELELPLPDTNFAGPNSLVNAPTSSKEESQTVAPPPAPLI